MKQIHLLTFLGLLFLLPAIADAEQQQTPAAQFRIGVILPLSGESASLGNYARKAVELAYQQRSAAERRQVALFFEDDRWNVTLSVTAYHKLVDEKGVQAIMVMGSAVGNALAPLAERDRVVLIALGASDFNLVKGRHFSFLHWVTPETEGQEAVKEMLLRDYKRIAFITAEQVGWLAVYKAVLEALKRSGRGDRVVLDQTYLPEERDFHTYIARARQKDVNAIVIGLLPGSLSAFVKLARQAGISADFIGLETFEDENEVKAASGALYGQWYVNAGEPTPEFIELYRKGYQEYPAWTCSNSFDSVNLLVDGFKINGANTGAIAQYLATLKDYHGAAGRYSATGDQRFTLPATVKVVTKNGFEPLHR